MRKSGRSKILSDPAMYTHVPFLDSFAIDSATRKCKVNSAERWGFKYLIPIVSQATLPTMCLNNTFSSPYKRGQYCNFIWNQNNCHKTVLLKCRKQSGAEEMSAYYQRQCFPQIIFTFLNAEVQSHSHWSDVVPLGQVFIWYILSMLFPSLSSWPGCTRIHLICQSVLTVLLKRGRCISWEIFQLLLSFLWPWVYFLSCTLWQLLLCICNFTPSIKKIRSFPLR